MLENEIQGIKTKLYALEIKLQCEAGSIPLGTGYDTLLEAIEVVLAEAGALMVELNLPRASDVEQRYDDDREKLGKLLGEIRAIQGCVEKMCKIQTCIQYLKPAMSPANSMSSEWQNIIREVVNNKQKVRFLGTSLWGERLQGLLAKTRDYYVNLDDMLRSTREAFPPLHFWPKDAIVRMMADLPPDRPMMSELPVRLLQVIRYCKAFFPMAEILMNKRCAVHVDLCAL